MLKTKTQQILLTRQATSLLTLLTQRTLLTQQILQMQITLQTLTTLQTADS